MGMNNRTLRPSATGFSPRSISGLALWLDGSDTASLYTTDAGPVTAVASPLDIAGCVGWWDSSDLSAMRQNSDGTGAVAAGDPVGWWLDKSSTGATVTGSGSARPTLSATGFNSRQALVFNGSSTNLSNASYTATNSLSGMTRIAVCANTVNVVSAMSRVFGGGSDFFMQMNGSARNYVSSAANFLSVTLSSGSSIAPAGLYADVFSNSAISFYSSGSGLVGTVTGTIPATTGGGTPSLHIGSNANANFFWNGPIAEYIIFNRALTRAELARVESYLAAKWGISGVHRSASQEIAAVASPTEIAGCAGWWDASRTDKMWNATSGGSLVANGGAVLRLDDLSGNGKHLVQATSASAPSRQDGAKNGLPVLNFAGTKTAAAGAAGDWNFLHNTNGGTVIAVIKPFDAADPQTFAYGVATNVGGASNTIGWSSFFDDRYSGYFRNNHVSHYVMAGVSGQSVINQERDNAVPAANDFSLLSFTPFAGSPTAAGRAAMYVSGTAVGNANTSTLAPSASNSTNALTVGIAGSNSIAGLAELIVFNTVLSAVDRARVEKYLQQKWATPTVPDPTPPVGAWLDKSGNARHAVQATAGNRPVVGTVNSRRAVNFDGTDDTLAYLQGLTSNDLTTFCVYRYDALSGGVVFDYGYTGDNTNASSSGTTGFLNSIGLQVNTFGTINTRLDSTRDGVGVSAGLGNEPGTLASLAGTTAIHTAAASFGTSTTRYAAHAGASLSNTGLRFNGSVWSLLSLGSRRASGTPGTASVFLDGQICEFLMYERNLPQSQRRRIEQYLATRWGITLAPQVANADAQDWVNRVYQQGGSVSPATASAVNTFCESIASAGIRDRFYRLNLFCGNSDASLAAVRTPLFRGPSLGGTQYGNATDTNANFVAGDYSETSGLTGNGSTKYLDTGFAMNSLPATTSGHAAVYCPNRSSVTAFTGMIGVAVTGSTGFGISTDTSVYGIWGSIASAINSTNGLLLASRTSSSLLTTYVNGSSIATSTSTVTPAALSLNASVFANRAGVSSVNSYDSRRYCFYSIGTGLSQEDATALTNAVQAFQTALTRNV